MLLEDVDCLDQSYPGISRPVFLNERLETLAENDLWSSVFHEL